MEMFEIFWHLKIFEYCNTFIMCVLFKETMTHKKKTTKQQNSWGTKF
jgi:hypothetical protein